MTACRSGFLEPPKKLGQPVQLVDVIRRGVAGEAHDLEAALLHLAELLHAARAPAQHRSAMQTERSDEMVGGFGGARERAGEDLGMRDEEALLSARSRVIDAMSESYTAGSLNVRS